MARKFYTPIDLTGLELQNAKIQNLASDPSGYGSGGIYYNTAHNELRVYNGTVWVPVGGAIEYGNTAGLPSAGNAGRVYADTQAGTLFLDNGTTWVQIGMSASATTDNVTEGSTNLYYTDARARQAISGTSGVSYDFSTGTISIDYTGLEEQLQSDGYITGSQQYIQSTDTNFSVSGTELTLNTSNAATTLTTGATYTTATGGVIDVNLSAIETQLQSDGYITGSEQYIQSVGSEFSVAANELTLNTDGTLYVNGSNQLAVQYGTGLTVDGSGFLEVDETVIATKTYVDGVAQGLRIKDSIDAAALVNVTGTYTDGTTDASGGLGIGATFTTTVSALDTATGDTDVVNDRIGLFDQSTATQNGIYTVTANDGTNVTLTRSIYEDNSSLDELHYGNFYFVSAGTSAGTGWVLTNEGTGTNEDIKIGTDPVEFTQFSGSGAYLNGNGISISGNTISAVVQGTEGMQLTSGGIGVNAGTGLEFNGSTGALQVTDYNIITKKYAETIGDATNTTFTVTHSLGTTDVMVTIFDTSSMAEVFADVVHTSDSVVTVSFAVAPSTNAFRVVVIG